MLKISDQDFKTSMLRALMDKVDSIKKQMGNLSRKTEILKKNQKDMLEIKNTGTEMKKSFDGLLVNGHSRGKKISVSMMISQ